MKNQTQINVSEVQLIYKNKVKASDRIKITCSRDAQKIFMEKWNPETIDFLEEFKMLLLNRSNAVLGIFPVSIGGHAGTVTDVRLIYQAAIKANACGTIICHNHPSGNINPSESDNRITEKIKSAGNLLDIQLLDHLIITTDGDYFSYADSGLI
jgi:DNA repair protein RadC